jgi:hypothetical protein
VVTACRIAEQDCSGAHIRAMRSYYKCTHVPFTYAVGDNSEGSDNSGIKSIQAQEGPGRWLAEEGAGEDLEKSPSLLSPCLSSLVLALTLTLRRLSTPLTYDPLTTHARMQDHQRVPDTDTERAQHKAEMRTPTTPIAYMQESLHGAHQHHLHGFRT